MLYHISNLALLENLKRLTLTVSEHKDLENVPTLMICYLNGFDDAKGKLVEEANYLKPFPNLFIF
jgi:hypothetical protein